MKTPLLPLFALLAGLGAAANAFPPAPAGKGGYDWPQWRGPNRDDVSRETGLLQDWPGGGPQLLWTYNEAGAGFSGPAVVGDTLYTMGVRDDKEVLFALDVRGPKQLWAAEVGPFLVNGWGDGPRGTPAVDDGRVYALGGQGRLVCVDASNGKEVWAKSLKDDLGGAQGFWGFTESPLVDGDQVVCTPGGAKGTVAALDKRTGAPRWQTKELTDKASYASLVAADFGGVRQYVVMTPEHVAGVAARDGKVLWSFARKGPTAAIPTPVVSGDLVFVTSGYDAGCNLLRVKSEGGTFSAEEVYKEDTEYDRIVNHHGGVVLVDGYLYGYSEGRAKKGPKQWACQELKTGRLAWGEGKKLGKGSLTYAEGRLYCYGEGLDGSVVLVAASPAGWEEHGRFTLPQKTKLKRKSGLIWTHPVVSNGRLYLRDQDLLFCYDVKAR